MTRVAVILPCLNEEAAIGAVVEKFRKALPAAEIYVYDNASTDDTAGAAARAGAFVRKEPTPGKGNAVTRAFADIDADIYVVADGDGTYDAALAPAMIDRLRRDTLDMVVGVRAHKTAAAPLLWMEVFTNHTQIHAAFTQINYAPAFILSALVLAGSRALSPAA